jgi:hypothetical protein
MATGTLAYVRTCTVATNPCPVGYETTVQSYLIDPLYQTQTDFLLAQSGIDWQAVYDAFGMSLLLFAVGAGCGLLINVVKKVKV